MADYIYLLDHRLSPAQQAALHSVREIARAQGVTLFLVGGAVRDLTSGSPVRDLDVVVQGDAAELKSLIEAAGGALTGQLPDARTLFFHFPGGVRMEVGSTVAVSYPKPGQPLVELATIQDDLRRRDFTANAMAISLNDGSYGLLMDPLNGVADIENRQLRLVSNYGFIEDPARMIRAARFSARLGWTMDEKTQARYETGKEENYIAALSATQRGYETEEIFHEEDPLRILRRLEEEGWMKHLFPAITVAKANAGELEKLREAQTQLQVRGIHPEAASANFPLLTAKLAPNDLAAIKASFVRPGFVAEVEALEGEAKEFAAQLTGKGAALPSQAWKLLESAKPEAVLWLAYSSKSTVVQTKLKSFYTEWPKARQKIPYPLMQEMRIVPDLPNFNEVVDKLFYELMDGKLGTVEEIKAFLEPYSPPAPPPPVRLQRQRAGKKDAKGKGRKKATAVSPDEDDGVRSPVEEPDEDLIEAAEDEHTPAFEPDPAGDEMEDVAEEIVASLLEAPAELPVEVVVVPAALEVPAFAQEAPQPLPDKKAAASSKLRVSAKKVVAQVKAPGLPKLVAAKTAAKPIVESPVKPISTTRPAAPAKQAVVPAKKAVVPAKKLVGSAMKVVAPAKKGATKAVIAAAPAKKAVPAKKVVPLHKAVPAAATKAVVVKAVPAKSASAPKAAKKKGR